MPLIIYKSHDGNTQEVHAETGTSIMQAAVDNGIDGILGECGGCCSCATCHCYIDPAWVSKVSPADSTETDMLDCVLEPQETSRLSCQVIITDEMDGIIIAMPESQY
ncbi:MAG: 2Fe-2S iron-sulfur cluster-binding protein [Zhongshania sp.]|uniref:2Fe-2S iron-sulfur cluster-binding protein n=1 Tax=Zhongshania sp. TaxID=1971902 RepID=UPI00262D8E42|nr:2Fe-2S iron-sulfur cluster-binding protein [Zhongshania sp.]MDF1691836.1 2Fe-2S iron-sulfur cluster-binding protein [Zhongshania sp.]